MPLRRQEVATVNKRKIMDQLFEQKVVILFVILCVLTIIASKQPLTFVANELFTRIARNSFLVLALIIPVLAGMGLNFGIVIGAMAAQIAVFLTTHWGFVGIGGFLLTALLATPMAVFFGFLVGKLFNKAKGSEMICGLVLGYFADGLYQLLFLFIFGGVIPINNPKLMIATGVGVKNTIDLKDTIKYSMDTVPMLTIVEIGFYIVVAAIVLSALIKLIQKQPINWKKSLISLVVAGAVYAVTFIPAVESFLAAGRLLLLWAVELWIAIVLVWQIAKFLWLKVIRKEDVNVKRTLAICVAAVLVYAITYIPAVYEILIYVRLPVMTYLCIAGLCLFNTVLMRTRLGQNMRTVGQSRVVANAAGINVDRTRITAMIFSTVLASWGQLIFLQNVGTFSTYGAHTQVGQFAIAALLVGGASVQKATNKQAILGVVLFHTLFIVAPLAGKELFGNAMIGEYFRVFVSYGVIALALAMHAWKKVAKVGPSTEFAPAPAGALGGGSSASAASGGTAG